MDKTRHLIPFSALLLALLIVTMPVASALQIVSGTWKVEVSKTQLNISYQTDAPADTRTELGLNVNNMDMVKTDSAKTTAHKVTYDGLTAETAYFLRATSTDAGGASTNSGLVTVNTVEATPPPKVTGLKMVEAGESYVKLQWDASSASDLRRYNIYRNGAYVNYSSLPRYQDDGLAANTAYAYTIRPEDIHDNLGVQSDPLNARTLVPDTKAPSITGLGVADVQDTTARITWNTDEDANTTVLYGQTTALSERFDDAVLSRVHNAQLVNLETMKKYYYTVRACDIKNNCATSAQKYFIPGVSNDAPSLDVALPTMYNRAYLDVVGNSSPYARIDVYVNAVLSKSSTLENAQRFTVPQVRLDTAQPQNTVKIKATSPAGQETEREFLINVDVVAPVLEMADVANVSTSGTITLRGNISKLTTMKLFVRGVSQTPVPGAVSGLTATAVGSGVTLKWGQAANASKYAVYRQDIGLIAVVAGTTYTDVAVERNTQYSYSVAGLNAYCELGARSNTAVSIVLTGTGNTAAALDLASQCQVTPTRTAEVAGPFQENVNLQEGYTDVKVVFTDAAGNAAEFSKTFYSRSRPPTIVTNLANMSVSYNQHATIRGSVDEEADVYVFVNNHTNSRETLSTSVQEILRRFGDIGNSGNYKAHTDQNGNFEIPITLDMNVEVQTDSRPTSYGTTAITSNTQLDNQFKNHIVIVAVGKAGNTASVSGDINYAICGIGGDWLISVSEFYPSVIKPRYWIDGFASMSFSMNMTWGPGSYVDAMGNRMNHPRVQGIQITSLSPMPAEEVPKFDVQYMGAPQTTWASTENGYLSFTQIPLNKPRRSNTDNRTSYEYELNLSKNHMEECFLGTGKTLGMGCIRLPLQIVITYEGKVPQWDGQIFREVNTQVIQKTCVNAEVALDRRVNPDLIPKKFLQSSVKFLNETINAIDVVYKPLTTITEYATYGCMITWVGGFVVSVMERFSCTGAKMSKYAKECNGDENAPCGDDKDFEKQNTCYKAMARTKTYYHTTKYLCNRVMCPAVPTFDKYIELAKAKSASKESRLGGPSTNCIDAHANYADYEPINADEMEKYKQSHRLPPYNTPEEKWCKYEYEYEWGSGCMLLGSPYKESFCVSTSNRSEDSKYVTEGCGGATGVVRSVGDFSLCKNTETSKFKLIKTGVPYSTSGQNNQQAYIIDTEKREAYLATYYSVQDSNKVVDQNGKPENGDAANIMQEKRNDLANGKAVVIGNNGMEYWSPVNAADPVIRWDGGACDAAIQQSSKGTPTKKEDIPLACKNTANGNNLCFECYYKNRITNYNPQEKADLCTTGTGTNKQPIPDAVWRNVCEFSGDRQYVVDPTSGLLRSVQCVCLTTTKAYLGHYRTIMNSLKKCFETILYTGDGSAGTCRALISVHVCDLVYSALNCLTQKSGKGFGSEMTEGIGGVFQSITGAMGDAANSVRDEYGGTNMYRALFVDQKIVHAACVGAFTGDWDVAITGAINQAIDDQYINSTVLMPVAEREFLNYNPITGLTSHMYHAAIFFAAGSEITNLRIEMVCSQDNSCNYDDGTVCDCAHRTSGTTNVLPVNSFFGVTTGLARNQVLDKEAYIPISAVNTYQAGVRYDKFKVSWDYRPRGSQAALIHQEQIFPIKQMPPKYPAECKFDIARGIFGCSAYSDPRGALLFNDPGPTLSVNSLGSSTPYAVGNNPGEINVGAKLSFTVPWRMIPPAPDRSTSYHLIVKAKTLNGQDIQLFGASGTGSSLLTKMITPIQTNPVTSGTEILEGVVQAPTQGGGTTCVYLEPNPIRLSLTTVSNGMPGNCYKVTYNAAAAAGSRLTQSMKSATDQQQCLADINYQSLTTCQSAGAMGQYTCGSMRLTVNEAQGSSYYYCPTTATNYCGQRIKLELSAQYSTSTSATTSGLGEDLTIYGSDGPQVRSWETLLVCTPVEPAGSPTTPTGACSGDGIILYDGRDFSGNCILVNGDQSDLKTLSSNGRNWDNRIVSIQFSGSFIGKKSVTFYKETNYAGTSAAMADMGTLDNDFNQEVSSIKIVDKLQGSQQSPTTGKALLIGDSMTNGYYAQLPASCKEKVIKVAEDNAHFKTGTTPTPIQTQLQKALADTTKSFDMVIALIGVNDLCWSGPPQTANTNIPGWAGELKTAATNKKVYLIEVPPMGGDWCASRSDCCKGIAGINSLISSKVGSDQIIKIFDTLNEADGKRKTRYDASDNIHMNSGGNKVVADAVANILGCS